MDVLRFIEQRSGRWDRLAVLLDRLDANAKRGHEPLAANEVDELFRLYRLASSDLNHAQTHTGRAALLAPLEALVARAHGRLTRPARARPLRWWWRTMRHGFPAAIRRQWAMVALATALLLGGAAFGAVGTAVEPDFNRIFLPAEHLSQTPAERVAELESPDGAHRVAAGGHAVFSAFLAANNIKVSVLALALGLSFGVGTAVVMFFNGALLGCIALGYVTGGVGVFFVAWVGPHGSIELPCIVFAGAAGLIIGRAQWRGGGVWERLARDRDDLVALITGGSTLLLVAALIEGGFSQVNEPTLPYGLKIAVAGVLFVLLLAYLFLMPVQPDAHRK